MSARVSAFVGAGGNLGAVAATLRAAFAELDALPATRISRVSRLYRTPPWGDTAQPAFLNAAVALDTALDPRALLEALLAIERRHGRRREAGARWGPRTLDLDLLLYGDRVIDEPGLRVPHPHLHARAFVLAPLAEIAPGLEVPGQGRVRHLLAAVDTTGIEAIS